ncbi:ATP-dependent helicase [Agromyces aerolatus]|uniref:ATP-dependent helicase n=1 Tax=Agromyces sp. LY-1074 TaxID=3074080 RepID=UPI0028666DA6|nr:MULTISPECIES: ATP-dependent helicase [unclassified Agromyces]MDR5700723.1 ATP-dependent helicase [Agromyces sp. LY-1074]MDR5707244.1 ATP-dependent helicase [Agromyces sp. LY-1358]
MIKPTPSQLAIRDAAARDLLVIAPAGCGKTEALALRIQGLLQREDVRAPQKILVTTFSNRARDNIRERLQDYLSPAVLRERVSITNFHGLAARVFRAHANVIGLDPDMIIPDGDWVGAQCRAQNFDFNTSAAVQTTLREAKQEPRTDAEVEVYLSAPGREAALAIERQRVSEGRLTYDDLPRMAELILANDAVAELYRAHFGSLVVDEFQDLTPQQLRIVNRIGYKQTTFAGDLAQGIYGFAGAKPREIDAAIRAECTEVIEFSESHRSSPAVLAMVNAMAPLTVGTALSCADAASWPGGGLAASVAHQAADAEGQWVAKVAQALVSRVPGQRIGIIARTLGRRRFVEAALTAAGVPFFRWNDGVLDTDTARIMKSMLGRFDARGYDAASDKVAFLRDASGFESVAEPTGRESLLDALHWCHDLLQEGTTATDIRARIQVGDETTLITAPGVHLLTGHVGKGQQFDWVVIVGLEEGVIPDFRATSAEDKTEEARVLSVMISRARHGVIVSRAASVPTNSGNPKNRPASSFLTQLGAAKPLDAQGLVQWFKTADWAAITAR